MTKAKMRFCKIIFMLSFFLVFSSVGSPFHIAHLSTAAMAGICDYPDDIARDGSRCGGRAASVRPGGRNPDTDWLVWIAIIGFGIFVFAKLSGEGSATAKKQEVKPHHNKPKGFQVQTPKERVNSYKIEKPDPFLKPSKKSEILSDKVERIIVKEFGYFIDPMNKPVLDALMNASQVAGYNDFDVAIAYMLVQMNVLYPGADNSRHFVDLHSQNICRIARHCIQEKEEYLKSLNIIRENHRLSQLGLSDLAE